MWTLNLRITLSLRVLHVSPRWGNPTPLPTLGCISLLGVYIIPGITFSRTSPTSSGSKSSSVQVGGTKVFWNNQDVWRISPYIGARGVDQGRGCNATVEGCLASMCKRRKLPQHQGWRGEPGSEAEGDSTDWKGEARRKRPRFKGCIAEVWIWKASCCVFYVLQIEALPPGGRLMRVSKVGQLRRLKKLRNLQDQQGPTPGFLKQ